MMGKAYQRKTRRSKRRTPSTLPGTVSVETADGQARFQMMLPTNRLLFDVAKAIEETASQAGLLMMKALIDKEVEQIAGLRYRHQSDRQAMRWGQDEGHVILAGRKMAMPKPRVRSRAGTVLLEAEKRFHRIQGYREMPLLINALSDLIDTKEAVA